MEHISSLYVVDMGIDTHQEPVVYMRSDCHICSAEGFDASSRVAIVFDEQTLIASLHVVEIHILPPGHVGLSKIAIQRLHISHGQAVGVHHAPVLSSLSAIRKKVYGRLLDEADINCIVEDISEHRYSDIEIASFLSVCAGGRLNVDEIISLTRAMVTCGKRLTWPNKEMVLDKHCIGGLPGNRTTPLVVSIVSAAGHTIPKTSSRAITSPAGTADTMEVLTNVNLSMSSIQQVVEDTGACLVWGGAVNLSPADDLLIRIERALDLDGEGQLIASVLSKKIAAGSTHVIIDIPVGATAKVRSRSEAERLASLFTYVGDACAIQVRCVITDGSKPIGSGIGPVEEARDLLAVLQNTSDAPSDLRQRALFLSAHLLDLAEQSGFDNALVKATSLLNSGAAWSQFQRILHAQGAFKTLSKAKFQHQEMNALTGTLIEIDNRKLSRLTKLAGAPFSTGAGLRLHVAVGDRLVPGQPLFTLFSNTMGEQTYALNYFQENTNLFTLEPS